MIQISGEEGLSQCHVQPFFAFLVVVVALSNSLRGR